MKKYLALLLLISVLRLQAQQVNLESFNRKSGASVEVDKNEFTVSWPAGSNTRGWLTLSLDNSKSLFKSIGLASKAIITDLDPIFLLTVGKRDLISQNGWNIFFDRVPSKPFTSHRVTFHKQNASVTSTGSRTIICVGELSAPGFQGKLEVTLYSGSPLINIAAVISTAIDSTAIIYDAGLISKDMRWKEIAWSNVHETIENRMPTFNDSAKNEAVKYRTIIGNTANGSIAVFPAPHQYFYPLDEAFNLKFVWHGNNYRKMVDGYGIGIRQDLYGDKRYVPWFNAPPQTNQRLNFFVLLDKGDASSTLTEVKKFTNNDSYAKIPGYKTLSSHFHNEFTTTVVMAGKPIPDTPNFVKVFKKTGIDIVHLGEFHGTGHPKGPDDVRLKELQELFRQCERLSDAEFLLLPGEEPNEFFGGHWLQFFPKPVYWIMSRIDGQPFVTKDSVYGTVYRIRNAAEMIELLKRENGLAWTAHPRTKGSTGYPDRYKNESFFNSQRFLGAAWKPIPADLSWQRLGVRVLDLMDDMNNWGFNKMVLAESDLFTIEPENEMYAHLNVNYLMMDKLPSFKPGWQSVLNALQHGKFFSTTGEVLIPKFSINNGISGDTVKLGDNGEASVSFELQWTFPMHHAAIISGDGEKVYTHIINLDNTTAFSKKRIFQKLNLKGRKWVRLEAWDAAVNGAFTQSIWLK